MRGRPASRGPVGACHAGRLVRAAGRERRRKGQRKDPQQGHVSCRGCTDRFLSLPVLTGTIYPQILTEYSGAAMGVTETPVSPRPKYVGVGFRGESGRARTGLVFAGSQPRLSTYALAKGGAAQSQASRQSKLSTGIDEPPTLRTGGSWGLSRVG